jgi:trehalose 6-phosphate phosphatase
MEMPRKIDMQCATSGVPPLPEADAAFFLDIDGTLLEIADTPSAVRVDRQLLALVQSIHEAAGGAVALISGRRIADIDGLFPGLRLPLAGQHGIERRDGVGGLHMHPAPLAELARLRQHFDDIVVAHPGLLLEDKGATLAVHYRRAPQAEAEVLRALTGILKRLGEGFRIQPGKMVFEIKPAGKDKGTAIAEFLEEAPFRGRTPVFLGDDVTDEYGFHVVNARGGSSIKVGTGHTVAGWRLPDVAAVRAWLARCLMRLAPSSPFLEGNDE